jgi:hypothetical protein
MCTDANKLTPWNSVFLVKIKIAKPLKNFLAFLEPENSV